MMVYVEEVQPFEGKRLEGLHYFYMFENPQFNFDGETVALTEAPNSDDALCEFKTDDFKPLISELRQAALQRKNIYLTTKLRVLIDFAVI